MSDDEPSGASTSDQLSDRSTTDEPPEASTASQPSEDTLDRNLSELLQELRVTLTGVQVLVGFLLTVSFTQVFQGLERRQGLLYLAVLGTGVLTIAVMVTPVAFHRVLFRRRRRQLVVDAANVCSALGLALQALTMAGVVYLIFDVVAGREPGYWAFGLGLLVFLLLWWVAPRLLDRLDRRPRNEPPPSAAQEDEPGR